MIPKHLKDPGLLGGCIYYSQNREDLVLQAFFSDDKKGFYVDIGAYHPDIDSVTKLFYLEGWHGINIEPQTELHKLFEKHRKRDINLNIGIAQKDTSLKLRAYKSGGLSTFSDKIKKDYEQDPDQDTGEYTETIVQVHPLKKVLAEQKVTHIDFMKVDVEGFEYDVLASNDWQRFRPEVLCIEANHVEKDWRPLLRQATYELVFFDGLNEYYADSTTNRKAKFHYVKEVISDRGGGIRAEHYQMIEDWRQFGLQKANHVEEVTAEKQKLEEELAALERICRKYEVANRSVKQTGKRFFWLLNQRLRGKEVK